MPDIGLGTQMAPNSMTQQHLRDLRRSAR